MAAMTPDDPWLRRYQALLASNPNTPNGNATPPLQAPSGMPTYDIPPGGYQPSDVNTLANSFAGRVGNATADLMLNHAGAVGAPPPQPSPGPFRGAGYPLSLSPAEGTVDQPAMGAPLPAPAAPAPQSDPLQEALARARMQQQAQVAPPAAAMAPPSQVDLSRPPGTQSSWVPPQGPSMGSSAQAPLAVRNNNPGNLRFVGQAGAEKGDGGFARFATPEDGASAMAAQLLTYQNRDGLNTVGAIIGKWAPPNENDTRGYAKTVADALGVAPGDKIDLNDPKTLTTVMGAMNRVEAGPQNAITGDPLQRGVAMALSGASSPRQDSTGVAGLDGPTPTPQGPPQAPQGPAGMADYQGPSMFSQQNLLRLAAGLGKGRNLAESIGGGAEALANGMDQDFGRARAMQHDALAQRRAGTDEQLAQAHIMQARMAPAKAISELMAQGMPPAAAARLVQQQSGGVFKPTAADLEGLQGGGRSTHGDLYYAPDGQSYREMIPKFGTPSFVNTATGEKGGVLPKGSYRAQDGNMRALNKDDGAQLIAARHESDQGHSDLATVNTLQSLVPSIAPGSDIVSTIKRNASQLTGMKLGDTDPAAIQLASTLYKQMDVDRIKMLGGSGLGRINLTEVNAVKAAGPNWQQSPAAINALLNFRKEQIFAKQQMVEDWDNAPPEDVSQGFGKFKSKWLKGHVTPALDASGITGQPGTGITTERSPNPSDRPSLSSFQRS